MQDLQEGKGGVDIDQWIVDVGRGAIGNGIVLTPFFVNISSGVETSFNVFGFKKCHFRGE
jgi:hypothetical protein